MNDEALNPEAEELYLVSLLFPTTSRLLRSEALAAVAPDDFWSPHYAAMWSAARNLHYAEQPVTKRAVLAKADSAAVARIVERLPASPPPAAEYPQVVATVRKCGQMRRLLAATERIQQRALIAEDFPQALGWAQDELANLDRPEETDSEVRGFADLLREFVAEQRSPTPKRMFRTPWVEVDDEIVGLHGRRMYVIGARPGDGKSLAAHQIAEYGASSGHPAIVFSAEMGADEVTGRVVSSGAQVEISEIHRRSLSADSWRRVDEYADRAQSYPLFVVDKSDLTIPYIKSVCRNQKRRTGLDIVVIDYLQLLNSTEKGQSREQQVAHISRQLKILAGELDAAVVVPAQLNREPTRRGKATLADLRESGGIEADADVVLLLARQTYPQDHELSGQYNGMLTIDIAKNRHGRQGSVELPWRAHYSTIGNPDRSQRFEPERHLSVVDGAS